MRDLTFLFCPRIHLSAPQPAKIIALKVRSALPLDVKDSLVPKHPCDAVALDSTLDANEDEALQAPAKAAKIESTSSASASAAQQGNNINSSITSGAVVGTVTSSDDICSTSDAYCPQPNV